MSEHQCPMCGDDGYKDGCEVCGRFRRAEVPKTIGSEIDAQTETGKLLSEMLGIAPRQTAHDHKVRVLGCFRCDPSGDEAAR